MTGETTSAAPELIETPKMVTPGDVVHCLVDGLTIPSGDGLLGAGIILNRGQTFVVTDKLIHGSKNRHGEVGWPALVHDEDAQVRRWGRRMLAPGEASPDLAIPEHGTPQWVEAREAARVEAWRHADPQKRAAAKAELERTFGPAPVTSRTVGGSFE